MNTPRIYLKNKISDIIAACRHCNGWGFKNPVVGKISTAFYKNELINLEPVQDYHWPDQ